MANMAIQDTKLITYDPGFFSFSPAKDKKKNVVIILAFCYSTAILKQRIFFSFSMSTITSYANVQQQLLT